MAMSLHTCTASSLATYDPSCAACRQAYARDNKDRGAAVFPATVTWKCERCGKLGFVGNETHRCGS